MGSTQLIAHFQFRWFCVLHGVQTAFSVLSIKPDPIAGGADATICAVLGPYR